MKKLFIILLLNSIFFLFAENISINSPFGGLQIKVEDNSVKKKKVGVVDEIAKKLDMLEKNYCSKLNGLDRKKAGKILDEIYDLLTLLPTDITITAEISDETSSNSEITAISGSSSNANASININVNVQDETTTSDAPIIEEKPISKAMSESEFRQLLQNVENEGFADDKTSVVRIAAQSNYFTIDQLVRLLEAFSFSEDKINIVRIVYPKITDKDNAHNLLNAFTYSEDKQEVEKIITQ